METVTVSPKYQVVIPRAIRERMPIRAGQRLQVISIGDRIELVPIRPMREMKGFLKGFDPAFRRLPGVNYRRSRAKAANGPSKKPRR